MQSLVHRVRPHVSVMVHSLAWMSLVAASTAAYGVLAGPALGLLFGTDAQRESWLWGQRFDLAVALPVGIVGAALCKGLSTYGHTRASTRFGLEVATALRERAHAAVLSLPPDLVRIMGSGDLLTRIGPDVEAAERLFTNGIALGLRDLVTVVTLLGLCVVMDARLAGLTFLVYPIALIPMLTFMRRIRRAAREAQTERGLLSNIAHQQFAQLPILQVHDAQAPARAVFAEAARRLSLAQAKAARLRALSSPTMEVFGALGLVAVLIHARGRVAQGELSPEDALGFLASALMLYAPIKGLGRVQEVWSQGTAALARLDELGIISQAAEPMPGLASPGPGPHRIELRALSIERGGRLCCGPVNATFLPDRLNVVVGPNGSGKTTLAWALTGLLKPERDGAHGEILVNELPMSAMDASAWRQTLGYCGQTTHLGRGTLWENATFGQEVPPDRVEALADMLGLKPCLDRLPRRWETPLADDGAGLSGGEQRRLGLLRALVREPSVLIVDEPEASLDAAALPGLAALLRALCPGRTVIVFTHAPSLVLAADHVVELQDPTSQAR